MLDVNILFTSKEQRMLLPHLRIVQYDVNLIGLFLLGQHFIYIYQCTLFMVREEVHPPMTGFAMC